jgi:rhomboid family GlyGly-CTERM serine protease
LGHTAASTLNVAEPTHDLPPPAVPWATSAIVALALAAYFWPASERMFEFDRAAISAGEFWRLGTSHLVHYSASHLFWNTLVLGIAGGWAERIAPWRTRIYYLIAPWLIGGALLALDSSLQRYAGLSGIAAGALALLTIIQLRRAKPADKYFWRGILLLLGAKIALELFSHEPAFARFASNEIRSVPLAHLTGIAAAGLAFFARRRKFRGRA